MGGYQVQNMATMNSGFNALRVPNIAPLREGLDLSNSQLRCHFEFTLIWESFKRSEPVLGFYWSLLNNKPFWMMLSSRQCKLGNNSDSNWDRSSYSPQLTTSQRFFTRWLWWILGCVARQTVPLLHQQFEFLGCSSMNDRPSVSSNENFGTTRADYKIAISTASDGGAENSSLENFVRRWMCQNWN